MMENLLEEQIELQKKKLYDLAQKIIPYLTEDDLLQPNDFPQLENHPLFRFEEGFLMGLMSAKAFLLALTKDKET